MSTEIMPKYSKARTVLGLSFMEIEKTLGTDAADAVSHGERDLTAGELATLKQVAEAKPKKVSTW